MTLKEVLPEPMEVPVREVDTPVSDPYRRGQILKGLFIVRKYSAYAFTAFAGLHLTSTVGLPFLSVPIANTAFMFARAVYQTPLTEPLMIASLATHTITGMLLHAYRIYCYRRDYGQWNSCTSAGNMSGLVSLLFVSLHVWEMRYRPLKLFGDSSSIDLGFVSYLLNNKKLALWGFALLVSVTSFHAISGFNTWWRLRLGYKKYLVFAGTLLATALSLAALKSQPAPLPWLAADYARI